MKEIRFIPEFNIGDVVYHKTPESDAGVIVNIKYYTLTNIITYMVAIGFGREYECVAEELSASKVY